MSRKLWKRPAEPSRQSTTKEDMSDEMGASIMDQVKGIQDKIEATEKEIEASVNKLEEAKSKYVDLLNRNESDTPTGSFYNKKIEELQTEKKQLRTKEEQLRTEKELLLKHQTPPTKKIKLSDEDVPRNTRDASVSTLAMKDNDNIQKRSLYGHWFAIQLYNIYLQAVAQTTTTASDMPQHEYIFEFRGKKFQIAKSHLEDAVRSIKASCNLAETSESRGISSDSCMCSSELSFSCLYSRSLDRFLFKDPTKGACLHQVPSRVRVPANIATLEKMDTCAIALNHNGSPSSPVLFADLKQSFDNMVKACRESALCAINGVAEYSGRRFWPIQLGIPSTRQCSMLKVYIASNKTLYEMEVAKGEPHNKALLLTLYVAVSSLIESPIDSPQAITCPLPEKGVKVKEVNDRVIRCENGGKTYICKLYDSSEEEWNIPNLQLIKNFEYFEEAETLKLSNDGRLSMLRYQYIPNGNCDKPRNLQHFTGVLKCLKKLHGLGYVHGDVRIENIVFTSGGSFLIDFDLARKESLQSCYSVGYSTTFEVRHPSAKPHNLLNKEYDVYSIKKIICSFFGAEDLDSCTDINDLCTYIESRCSRVI